MITKKEKDFNKIKLKEREKGITLIALVITIIVLLILAGVSIAMLTGENGILKKASDAKETYAISQAKEKVELAIQELRIEEESKGNSITKESLKRLEGRGDYGISVKDPISDFPVEVVCEIYKFKIDENYRVTYAGEVDGTIVTYTTEPAGYTNQDNVTIKIKVENPKGIKEIQYPEGKNTIQAQGRTKVAIDYTVTKNGIYTFKVIDSENKELTKDIVIDLIDKLEPKDFTITAQATENGITITGSTEDTEATSDSTKSGIDKYEYYVTDESNNTTKYDTNEITGLKRGTYSVYAIAYDRAGNPKQSNTVSSIKVVAILKDITAEMIAANPTKYYGKVVTNYTAINGWSEWKIFHSDGNNIYLITNDYITSEYIPYSTKNKTTTNNKPQSTSNIGINLTNILNDYTGSADITTENPAYKWLENYLSKYPSCTGYNMKAVAYLMDTTAWRGFTDGEKASYAIAGPPIELFFQSYNLVHPTGQYTPSVFNTTGYRDDSGGIIFGKNEYNGLYSLTKIPSNGHEKDGAILPSPSAGNVEGRAVNQVKVYSGNAMEVGWGWYDDEVVVRPIVCLNSIATINAID